MRILHLSRTDYHGGGGAAMSVHRLHNGLRNVGVDSAILCQVKTTESPHVSVIRPLNRVEKVLRRISSRIGLNDVHRISSFRLTNDEAYKRADLLHFHSTHSGFINYLALPLLTRGKPSVFTVRDMWALTGHCGYSYECDRWRTGCGRCPHLDENPRVRRDLTRVEWKLKKFVYSRSNLTIVSPSSWLAEMARDSILGRFPIHHIPNGVDTSEFKPYDPEMARRLLGVPPGKKVLMFAATRLGAERKGYDLLVEALHSLPQSIKRESVLLVMGENREKDSLPDDVGIQKVSLGYVAENRLKAMAFSAADIFVFPTRAENFANVLLESMACGTPVISFRVGGVPETVRHGTTGYLAQPEDAKDLRDGILELLEDERLRNRESQHCRMIAETEFSLDLAVERYSMLYRQLLHQNGLLVHQSSLEETRHATKTLTGTRTR